jgi:glycosyltransferase involved in cell wall biosynthesis
MTTWGDRFAFGEHDWLVLPEVTSRDSLDYARRLPCRKVIHNQNPFYTFRGFADVPTMNRYGLAGGIVCSRFTGRMLRSWGAQGPWHAVRPPVHAMFAAARGTSQRARQIAFMPRKRPDEATRLRQLLCGIHPELADVPWLPIDGVAAHQVADAMARSLVFASLSRLEGLGLPPLEAMAAGCLVCGYHGGGGTEYSTPDNGFWVEDGDVVGFVHALAAALRLTPQEIDSRVEAGRITAAAFSEHRFRSELEEAWSSLLGADRTDYEIRGRELAGAQDPFEGDAL